MQCYLWHRFWFNHISGNNSFWHYHYETAMKLILWIRKSVSLVIFNFLKYNSRTVYGKLLIWASDVTQIRLILPIALQYFMSGLALHWTMPATLRDTTMKVSCACSLTHVISVFLWNNERTPGKPNFVRRWPLVSSTSRDGRSNLFQQNTVFLDDFLSSIWTILNNYA